MSDNLYQYIVIMRNPNNLVEYKFTYWAEDSNDAWNMAQDDNLDLDVYKVYLTR